jgi:hypothetical protein
MPDREFDHRKESAGMKEAIRQIEERLREISQAAEDKINETIERYHEKCSEQSVTGQSN